MAEDHLSKTIVTLFNLQVQKNPGSIAVSCQGHCLTYRQLDRNANKLAADLITSGVKADSIVGLFFERSVEMIVGMLGVLKAGGAYLPIDTTLPPERLGYICEDANLSVIVSRKTLLSVLTDYEITKIDIESIADLGPEYDFLQVENPCSSRNLAYVIYTSGSTGKPKGVLIEHGNVVNLIYGLKEKVYHRYHNDLNMALLSPYYFDASVKQIFTALLSGYHLHIVPEKTRFDGSGLALFYKKNKIDISDGTPIHISLLLQGLKTGYFDFSIKHFLIGGEILFKQDIQSFLIRFKTDKPMITNVYGPSECCGNSTWFTFDEGALPFLDAVIPIGQPMPNEQVLLLDREGGITKDGGAGEIYIGGSGVGRGYLNKKDLTQSVFLKNIDPENKDAVFYKTGDIAKRLSDGNLEYIGRSDAQVKIRGYRIELGEIENIMALHKSIKKAVVMVREDQPGNKKLVVYFTLHEDIENYTTVFRHFLSEKLPEYMIPQYFVQIQSFPVTGNGKIDRRALLEQKITWPAEQMDDKEKPRHHVDEIVLSLWQQILGFDHIAITDNFFEIGGHSLDAISFISKLDGLFSFDFRLNDFLKAPVIRDISDKILSLSGSPGKESEKTEEASASSTRRKDIVPLTSNQTRVWFIDQLTPGEIIYNLPYKIKISGHLDITRLTDSIQWIIHRHEALRTTFRTQGDLPFQMVSEVKSVEIPFIDLTAVQSSDQFVLVQEHIKKTSEHPFDLARGPLVVFRLLKLAEMEHILLFTTHHIIFDGISFDIFMNELQYFFSNSDKFSPGIDEPGAQVADVAIRQQEWIRNSTEYAENLRYWLKQLNGRIPILHLPIDFQRPTVRTSKGSRETIFIAGSIIEALSKISRDHGATLFMTLISAFNVFLFRYTRQKDICIGYPVSGRTLPQNQNSIGFFANTLIYRVEIKSEQSFEASLEKTREYCFNALKYQDVPYEKIVQHLNIERDLSITPLYQAMFVYEPDKERRLHFENLVFDSESVILPTAQADLTMYFGKHGSDFTISFEYSTDLFEQQTVQRMLDNFKSLLKGIVTDPKSPISELPILSKIDLKIISELTDTVSAYPEETIHGVFERQAAETPDAEAIFFNGILLSYAWLNKQANQAAHYLISMGVRTESMIGLCIERSIDMVVWTLGILKSGAVFVPIDPEYPLERIAFIVNDSQTNIIVTQRRFENSFSNISASIVLIEREKELLVNQKNDNPVTGTTRHNLAYIMYTSGSTGKPKGIEILHKNVVRLVKNTNYVKLDKDEVILQYAPISFDASTFEIWGTLLNGGKLVVCPPGHLLPGRLKEIIASQKVTTLWLTSAVFHDIVESHIECLKPIKQLLAGGDVLYPGLVKKVLREISGITLVNGYGPTENTTFTCCCRLTDASQVRSSVPIGKPVSNTQVYILDDDMKPVPVGVPGLLYASGDGVGRGYLNRPELTEKAFLRNPFSKNTDSVLYKTGDLVKLLPSGNLEFLGRIDGQVKLRGYRIELAEIDCIISEHKDIKQAVTIVREDRKDDKRLVLYFISNNEMNNCSTKLRNYLSEKLPGFMIPQYFIQLKSFPLTPNGKIDRKALPDPNSVGANSSENYEIIEPRTSLEHIISDIWKETLGIAEVSITDNFFEIGGHSLLAVKIFSKILKTFGLNLPLAIFFKSPTIEKLAATIESCRVIKGQNICDENSIWSHLVTIQPDGNKPPFFCIHAVGGNVLNYNCFVKVFGNDQPVYGLQSLGLDGVSEPLTDIRTMAEHYIREIQSIQAKGPYYLCGGSMGGLIAYEVACQLAKKEESVAFLGFFDTLAPGNYKHESEKIYIIKDFYKLMNTSQILKKIIDLINSYLKYASCKFFRIIKKPIPHSIRYWYVIQQHLISIKNYKPDEYAGDITLFSNSHHPCQKDFDLSKGWNEFVRGKINIIPIPANHHEFIESHFLSGPLRKSLEDAQAKEWKKNK